MNVFGYIRTNKVGQQAQIDLQRAAIERAAEEMGIEVGRFYLDEGVPTGGDVLDRPAMASLADEIREGDILLASSAEAIARSAERLLAFMDWMSDREVTVHWADMIGFEKPVYTFNLRDARGVMHHAQVFLNLRRATEIARNMLDQGSGVATIDDLLTLKVRPTGLG